MRPVEEGGRNIPTTAPALDILAEVNPNATGGPGNSSDGQLRLTPRDVTRKCSDCGSEKPLDEYYTWLDTNRQGKQYIRRATRCRLCHNQRRERYLQAQLKEDAALREIRKARIKVREAIEAGRLKKPAKCSCCGQKTPKPKLHAHHHNGYAVALDVKFICGPCHFKEHGKRVWRVVVLLLVPWLLLTYAV